MPSPLVLLPSPKTGHSSVRAISAFLLLGECIKRSTQNKNVLQGEEITRKSSTVETWYLPYREEVSGSFFFGKGRRKDIRMSQIHSKEDRGARHTVMGHSWDTYRHGEIQKRWRGALSYLFCFQFLDSPVALLLLLFLLYQNRVPH